MKVILHDLDASYEAMLAAKCDHVFAADGKYAPCQGCFNCWTKHPAECFMKDSLQKICRLIGQADELVIVTKNLYGGYSAYVKNVDPAEHLSRKADAPHPALRPARAMESRRLRRRDRSGKGDLRLSCAAQRHQRRL